MIQIGAAESVVVKTGGRHVIRLHSMENYEVAIKLGGERALLTTFPSPMKCYLDLPTLPALLLKHRDRLVLKCTKCSVNEMVGINSSIM